MEVEMLEEFTKYNDQMILKRKRTKPPRPSPSSSSSVCGGSSGGGGGGRGGRNEFLSLVSSLRTTTTTTSSTEEDEDMANCLILLAQSGSPQEYNKFSSKKFTNLDNNEAQGKVGIYLYECKTCNRSFPSFQALGGHRASHKKPKLSSTTLSLDENNVFLVEEEKQSIIAARVNPPSPPSSIQSITSFKSDMKPKIHECSICGSEFSSGQALGGHMRRHRTAVQNNITPTRIINANDDSEKPRNILALDLNLPAPPEDDRRPDEKFLLFSSPALVDCHY